MMEFIKKKNKNKRRAFTEDAHTAPKTTAATMVVVIVVVVTYRCRQ